LSVGNAIFLTAPSLAKGILQMEQRQVLGLVSMSCVRGGDSGLSFLVHSVWLNIGRFNFLPIPHFWGEQFCGDAEAKCSRSFLKTAQSLFPALGELREKWQLTTVS
jgi:hypothetical protein